MKRLLCILLLISLLLTGCAGKTPAPEAPVLTTPVTEEPTLPESFPTDYAGKEPTQEELAAFFTNYVYASYADFPNVIEDSELKDKIHYLGSQEDYSCVAVYSAGVDILIFDIMVFHFTWGEGRIQVLSKMSGDFPKSPGLTIHCAKAEGRYIYFGGVSDYHWDSQKDVRIPIAWQTLRFTDEDGNSVDMDMTEKLGYLCILDAPLADFHAINQDGSICLDYSAYQNQKLSISDSAFTPIDE